MAEQLLTTGQAAARAGCSKPTIRRAIRLGNLRGTKFGRDWVINPSDLQSWLNSGGYKPEKARHDRTKGGDVNAP